MWSVVQNIIFQVIFIDERLRYLSCHTMNVEFEVLRLSFTVRSDNINHSNREEAK